MRPEYTRICEFCGKVFTSKSRAAKFCPQPKGSCRVQYFKKKNNIAPPIFSQHKSSHKPSKIEEELKEQIQLLKELDDIIRTKKASLDEEHNTILTRLNTDLKYFKSLPDRDFKFYLNELSTQKNTQKVINDFYTKLYDVKDRNDFRLLEKEYIQSRFHIITEQIKSAIIGHYTNSIRDEEKRYIAELNNQSISTLMDKATELNDSISVLRKEYEIETGQANATLISADDILNMNFITYPFDEGFENVFGNPESSFVAMIHGEANSGKSSFSIKFASYFTKFGKVCYYPLEEKIGETFKIKLEQNMKYGSFVTSNTTHPPTIEKEAKNFNLIVIDSINEQTFNTNDIEKIVKYRKNSGTSFLFIFQARRDGEYKGSAYYNHLADVKLKAVNGTVRVDGKNRFRLPDCSDESYVVFRPKKATVISLNSPEQH
ncbi:hypothetical protein IH575_04990 [Candidatus Dojkabacteria bacterium]|nr:hypothetical protein [Candidatus Dojkabacteria bacterium]